MQVTQSKTNEKSKNKSLVKTFPTAVNTFQSQSEDQSIKNHETTISDFKPKENIWFMHIFLQKQ